MSSIHTLHTPNRTAKPDSHRALPVLLIMHHMESSAGHVGHWLLANGFPLDIRRPRFGDALPETLEDHSGAVIFGGPQSANDSDDFIKNEIDWIGVALKEEKPLLGICLGAQMLALHLGGQVRAHREKYVECGYYPIMPTRQGAAMMNWPAQVYQWHTEGITAPQTSVLLAEGERFRQQAFQFGPAFGLQFHPEVTQSSMSRLVTRSAFHLDMPGARHVNEHLSGYHRYGPRQRQWLGEFLAAWVGIGEGMSESLPAAA